MLPKFCFFVLVLQTLEASKDVQDAPLGSLRFVQLLHRHGDRNPTKAFGPLDPNPESVWAQGWGQLTTLGMRQLHRLGQIIKKRYRGFISENYVHDEIYVRSTGVDRALMSAQCNLAGMFPPKGAQIWDQTIPWQPIPIHSKPVFLDWVMRSSKVCKAKLDSLIDHFLKTSPKVKRLIRDNLDLIRNVSIDAGLYTKGDDIKNLEAAWKVGGNLHIVRRQHKTLLPWATNEVIDALLKLRVAKNDYNSQATEEIKRIQGGPFLGQMLLNFINFTSGQLKPTDYKGSKQVKMMIYSGHDTNIEAVLGALNMYTPPWDVPYGATVFLELHQTDKNKENKDRFSVKIFYLDGVVNKNVTVKELKIPKCESPCALSKMVELYDYTATWTEEDLMKKCNTSRFRRSIFFSIPEEEKFANSVSNFDGYFLRSDGNFYKKKDFKATWNEAQAACAKEGAQLPIIYGPKTGNLVREIHTSYTSIWIGATDQGNEGRWTTPSGGELPYTNWRATSREPNNHGNEDCAVQRSDKLWNDIDCRSKSNFICQRQGGLDNRTIGSDGFYYKIHEQKKDWNSAQATCAAEDGHLPTMYSSKTVEAVRRLMRNTWIGATNQQFGGSRTGSHWQTPSGDPLPFTNWGKDEPNNLEGKESCAEQQQNQLWNDLDCAIEKEFLCQFDIQDCKETTSGSEYRGTKRVTWSGKKCQDWTSSSPHDAYYNPQRNPNAGLESNFCRNPSEDSRGPWCYTMDPNVRWEFCEVPFCRDANKQSLVGLYGDAENNWSPREPSDRNKEAKDFLQFLDEFSAEDYF